MRITNSMISNNSQIHIGNAKSQLMRSQDQYTTQKKIQRPSDDPTIAVRALQLRTRYSHITQYADANIKDAIEWIEDSEGKLKSIDSILTNMKGFMNQGANDTLDAKQRSFVLETLQGNVRGIFEDNANGTFSDRYVFTGFRTDTSLLFMEDTKNLEYKITENFETKDIDAVKVVTGGASYDGGSAASYAADSPEEKKVYRMALAYDNCAGTNYKSDSATNEVIEIVLKDRKGNPIMDDSVTPSVPITYRPAVKASTDADAYDTDSAPGINFLYDTGELILSDEVYEKIQTENAKEKVTIEATYVKKEFEKGDIRPEMYFACKSFHTQSNREIEYADPSGQDIRYEINFGQVEKVNVQALDALDTDIYRSVDYIAQTVHAVEEVENKLADVEKQLTNTTDTTQTHNLEKLKEVLTQELSLRTGVMQEAFSKGLTAISDAQTTVNISLADIGARDNRMILTKNRLADEKIDTEKSMSENEDIDIADAYINLTQADNLYQASLSATAKILGNSLLNYI
ncbi:MAG: hypothetical protein IJ733_15710 [Lachnospiraceae bacterium]|nr:hypothetical protein [Lachnospiraceae bacterium]